MKGKKTIGITFTLMMAFSKYNMAALLSMARSIEYTLGFCLTFYMCHLPVIVKAILRALLILNNIFVNTTNFTEESPPSFHWRKNIYIPSSFSAILLCPIWISVHARHSTVASFPFLSIHLSKTALALSLLVRQSSFKLSSIDWSIPSACPTSSQQVPTSSFISGRR